MGGSRFYHSAHGRVERTGKQGGQPAWEDLERGSGLSRSDMFRFAETFGKARHAIVVWSMGITQHRYGSDNVRAMVNLQLCKGNMGRTHTGLMPIRGHSGVQGGAEMGAQPGGLRHWFSAHAGKCQEDSAPTKCGVSNRHHGKG